MTEDVWRLKILEVIDNMNDSDTVVLELPDEFREWFKEEQGLKRWSNKRFQKVMSEAIKKYLKNSNIKP